MKVIIVGAGISGLTLAAALAQLAPGVEVAGTRMQRLAAR